ncbi:heavy-metal-associated domain-containing protein [Plantibacter sp. T3]|uniref:heavy-metal-associated domain-containing protein n=1 Tax=Plantibacter sp. T3 TaxID=2653161 RepID=UPI0012F3EA0A|nr:heavy-metal-associated domain-containing protein [Plantibacter sp. T3]VXB03800.1 Copper chaperone [Plantibacter sp. T3]
MSTTEYAVTGMTCSHCEQSVTEEVSQIPGVSAVDVSAASGRLVITSKAPVEDAAVLAAVDEAGYAATRA